MRKTVKSVCAGVALAVLPVMADSQAQTLYVDKLADPGGDGKSLKTAYNTIAAALNAAEAGWTVKVAPGVYDSEEMVDPDGYTNRVYITKRVHLKSIGGKEVTHIVGKWASESMHATIPGIGSDAVRGIRIGDSAYYSVIEGFTIRDGAAHTLDDGKTGYGGGVLGNGASYYVVDCVVSNCTALRGGALREVTAVRSWITGNKGGASAGRKVDFVNCLITGNDGASGVFMYNTFVNCTIAGHANGSLFSNIAQGYKIYNCIVANNVNLASSATPVMGDCNVIDSTDANPGFLKNANTALGNTVVREGGFDYHFFAPLVNDWRPLPSSRAVEKGDAKYLSDNAILSIRENVDFNLDFYGREIKHTGQINAGCVQDLSPVPAGGAVQFNSSCIIGGCVSGGIGLYAFSEEYPAQFNVKPLLATNERPIYVERENAPLHLFPQMDDSVWVATPPKGVVSTNSFVVTTNIVYVSPSGNDGNSGRIKGAPKKTLQAAVDSLDSSAVVVAAEGTYDKGGKVHNGVSNRVYVAYVEKRILRIIGAGRGKSFIKGAADPGNPTGVPEDGRGPNACRCVCLRSVAAVQGFTLTGGFSGYDPQDPGKDNSDGSTRGGAFSVGENGSSRPTNRYLYDCDITASGADSGAAAYGGTLVRCHISNCLTSTRGGLRYTRLYSCLVDGAISRVPLYSGGCSAFQCTFSENEGNGDVVPKVDLAISGISNCVVRIKSGKYHAAKTANGANVIEGVAENDTYVQHVTDNGGFAGAALMKNADDGDYRPLSCSPAVAGGETFDRTYERYMSDFNGNPLIFVGNRPAFGAVHTTVQAVVVPKGRYGTISSPSAITNALDEGESLTVRLEDANRPCIGFVVNGVTNVSENLMYTFSGGASGQIVGAVVIEPVYTTHWYVDANNGDDDNSGFTPGTARKTFKGIMEWGNRIYSGDTIHAAEGVYSNEVMRLSETEVPARVVVPNGVTIVADGERDETIIEGKAADEGVDQDVCGNGQGAIRCVAFNVSNTDYGAIIGFTLRNGHTYKGGYNDKSEKYVGGGVYSTSASNSKLGARVIDCLITNCCANRGGAGYNRIDYVNCTFLGNRAASAASAIVNGAAYGCVFARNEGYICVYEPYDIVNCTFFDNLDEGTATYDIANPKGGAAVYNTVAKGMVTGSSKLYFYASNCVFNSSYSSVGSKKFLDEKTEWVDESLLVFAPDGTPLLASHPVVDKADEVLVSGFERMDFEKDALGGQRVYNGNLDIGAVEFDWRALYAKTLGAGYAQVPSASPDVVGSAGGASVAVGSGALHLDLSGNPDGRNMRYAIPVKVLGDGTLSVSINGEVVASYSAADGDEMFEFRNTLAQNALAFSYDGNDDGAMVFPIVRDAPNFVITIR